MTICKVLLRLGAPLLIFIVISGCQDTQWTLNQRVIYTPPPLYEAYALEDTALHDCVQQTIIDQKITRREQLTHLVCRHAGVRSLTGLEHFSALQKLDVSHNPDLNCSDLAPLIQSGLNVVAPDHCR